MQFDLKCATDLAEYAVFDPAAMLHVINDRNVDLTETDVLERDVEQGNVLLYSWGSDGGTTFRVYVDEEPDEEVLAQAKGRKSDLLLRVPSGTLFACGVEYLFRPDAEPIKAEEFESATDPQGEGKAIPGGSYLVEAFEIRRPVRRRGIVDKVLGAAGCWGCITTVAGTAIAILLGLVLGVAGRHAGKTYLYWGAVVAAFWLLVAVVKCMADQRPSVRQFKREERESVARFPFDAVLVLEPLPDEADLSSLRGGCFGSGYPEVS